MSLKCRLLLFSAPVSILTLSVHGQTAVTGSAPTPPGLFHTLAQIPFMLAPQFQALGNRLQVPGNERVTLAGTLTSGTSSSNVTIVMELGGKLNISGSGLAGQQIIFNGTAASVSGTSIGNDLLESFVDDLAETLMIAAGNGAAPRLLGRRFRGPGGNSCDYYDVATLGVAIKQTTPLIKRYCFDSSTNLLASVHYLPSPSQSVTTQFGGWSIINNQAVPGTITRTADAAQVFQFQAQNAAVSPSTADGTFTLP